MNWTSFYTSDIQKLLTLYTIDVYDHITIVKSDRFSRVNILGKYSDDLQKRLFIILAEYKTCII